VKRAINCQSSARNHHPCHPERSRIIRLRMVPRSRRTDAVLGV